MKAILLCLCVCLCLFSCKKEETQGVFIRVRNASQYPLEKVVVNSQHTYGALGIGQISDYQSYAAAGSTPSVTLIAQGEDLQLIELNDMYAAGLESGHYTYVLDIIKNNVGGNRITTTLEQP